MRTPAAFVIDELETWGGTEMHLFELTRALDPRFDPEVIVLGRDDQAPRFEEAGVRVRRLPIERVFGPSGVTGTARLARALRGRRLVVSYHTASDLLAPVAAALVGAVALSSRRDMGFTKKPIHVRAQRQINKLVAGMTVVSAAVKGAVEASEGFPAERLHVIHNGIDASRHARDAAARARVRAEFGFADDDVVIGTLANFDPIKGYDVLLPAAEAVCRALPRARFLLCGRGPLHADSVQRIERAGLAQRILMPGARRDVPAVLQALDLFVLASHSEGFSNALLEGMAAGLPVLATDVGGNRALIQPELTGSEREVGVLVAPGDSAAVERGLIELAGPSPEAAARRARMGARARALASTDFTFAAMVKNYEDSFDAFIDEAGGAGARQSRRLAKQAVAGAWAALRPAVQRARPLLAGAGTRALVLCYHRVVDDIVGPDPAMVVTASTLQRQLEAVGRAYAFVPMDDLAAALQRGGPKRPSCAVTFDDGYQDNLTRALPVLRAVGAPATVYLTAGVMETGDPLWPERVVEVVARGARASGSGALGDLLAALFEGALPAQHSAALLNSAREEAAPLALGRAVVEALKVVPDEVRVRAVATLERALGASREGLPRYLTWDEAARLRDAGIALGSHTVTHPILPRTGDDAIARELDDARNLIRDRLGVVARGFAYPNGDHDQRVRHLVERAGHEYAVTLDAAPWHGDRYAIGRRCVSEQQSRAYAGPFSAALFLADVEGALDPLRGAAVRR
ncbi:MAG: polysaccharide deacetylase family protein [Deltaproteobacteria bacterium]|nr:polysaccharide deacetylase family protein [Deltaproteobacteria bacterium]